MPTVSFPLPSDINWSEVGLVSKYSTDVIKLARPVASNPLNESDTHLLFDTVPLRPNPTSLSDILKPGTIDNPIIAEAEKLITTAWPEVADQIKHMVYAIYALNDKNEKQDNTAWGCTCGHGWDTDPWTIYTQANNPGGMCEGWIHELGHLKLHTLGMHLESWDNRLILNSPTELYESPVRKDKLRPMGAVIQAQYSYIHVLDWELRAIKHVKPESVIWAINTNSKRLIEGIKTIEDNAKFTSDGMKFWDGLMNWTEDLIYDCGEYL